MKLPHADEIASVRAVVERGKGATRLKQMAETCMTSLAVLEVQGPAARPSDVPGDGVLESIIAAFPDLEHVRQVGVGATSYQVQLLSRRQQFEIAVDYLSPIVHEFAVASDTLHALQHKQHDAAAGPEFDTVRATLKSLREEAKRVGVDASLIENRKVRIEPLRDVLAHCHLQLNSALVEASRIDDPDGRHAWRVGSLAQSQLGTVTTMIANMGLTIGPPPEPALPDRPHPRHRRRLRAEAASVLEWMRNLSEALSGLGVTVNAEFERHQARLIELDQQIKAITG